MTHVKKVRVFTEYLAFIHAPTKTASSWRNSSHVGSSRDGSGAQGSDTATRSGSWSSKEATYTAPK